MHSLIATIVVLATCSIPVLYIIETNKPTPMQTVLPEKEDCLSDMRFPNVVGVDQSWANCPT